MIIVSVANNMNLKLYIISVDIGTTLIKFIIYNSELKRIAERTARFNLSIENLCVEFDAEKYWLCLIYNLKKLLEICAINTKQVAAIALSGQAETIVLVDREGNTLRKAISWMDQRSVLEVEELRKVFEEDKCYKITGQPKIITTWTVTKLLWIKNNEKDIFSKIYKALLLKDYIAFKFTGLFISEFTTYNYTYYFNIFKKSYWEDMLDYIGIKVGQLPILVEPGKNIGNLNKDIIKYFNFNQRIVLNIGANDQFAGMIGVGNINEGIISESTGTVLTLATIVDKLNLDKFDIPVHYNALKNTYACLMACESGGISLEWLKNSFFKHKKYTELDKLASSIEAGAKGLVFLPYLLGTNPPEFDPNIGGGFFNLKIFHNENYFIRAVLEGIGYLIRKNLEYLERKGIQTENIISLGGGSKSDIWNQIKADITGKRIKVSNEEDPVGLGVSILTALEAGFYTCLEDLISKTVIMKKIYEPQPNNNYEKNYKDFIYFYKCVEKEKM